MFGQFDRKWKLVAAHLARLGIAPEQVLAPANFAPLLPGSWSADNPKSFAHMAAVVVHKGKLELVPPEHLIFALDNFTVTFANAVFLVLSRSGEEVAEDSPHRMPREEIVERALLAHAAAAKARLPERTTRAPAVLVGERRLQIETAFGQIMLVDSEDIAIVPHLVRDGWYDRNLTLVIGNLLEPGMTFLDVGANFGTYTLIGAKQVGHEGRVLAFEPAPAIAVLLGESISLNGLDGHTKVMRCAVGAEEGVATLYEFALQQGGNTLLPAIAEDAKALQGETLTTREVECRTLDAVVAEQGLARVDLVKIDVEGYELQVLEGARDTIARFRPRLIVEWHKGFFNGRPEAPAALYDLLTKEFGYRLRRIDADGEVRAVGFRELMRYDHSDIVAEHEDAPESLKSLWS